ncbi:hypothetical protein F4782DRAFT_524684 [Xylaria castorea]|nr:hypothetical protein F4782DRAFT_524684 [Xylaria castorea]
MAGVSNTAVVETALNKTQFNHIDRDVDVHAGKQIQDSQALQQSWNVFQPRSGSIAPASLAMQELESSHLHELHAKIDGLSADMMIVKTTLKELQQGKPENPSLQKDLKQAQDDLQLAREQSDKIHKKWKKAASQLDQLRYKATETCQLADSDLIHQVMELRQQIRTFSYQYFQDKVPQMHRDTSNNSFWKYMTRATSTISQGYHAYLTSEIKRPFFIQAFLWRLLISEVLGKFCWVPSLRESIAKIYESLRPAYKEESNPEIPIASDADERFHGWSATTSALIVESIQEETRREANNDETKSLIHNISAQILEVIGSFAKNSSERISSHLECIIETAIALDRNICMQAVSMHWMFNLSKSEGQFDPDLMEQQVEVGSRSEKYTVDMVTAPALFKRSKRIGKNPEMEDRLLLKMTVTCVPISEGLDGRGSSRRALSDLWRSR